MRRFFLLVGAVVLALAGGEAWLSVRHSALAQGSLGVELRCPGGTSVLPGWQVYDQSTGQARQVACVDLNGNIVLQFSQPSGLQGISVFPTGTGTGGGTVGAASSTLPGLTGIPSGEATLPLGLVGALTNATGQAGYHYFFANAHTLTRLYVFYNTQGVACTTFAIAALWDITSGSAVSSVTLANGVGVTDSGALSVAMTAGHAFDFNLTTASSGCTTPPVITMTASYQ